MKRSISFVLLALGFLLITEIYSAAPQKPEENEIPINPTNPPPKDTAPKKQKAHFVGARRPAEKTDEKKRPSLKIKNQWVKSKTHPKKKEKEPSKKQDEEGEAPAEIPYFNPGGSLPSLTKRADSFAAASLLLQEEEDEEADEETPIFFDPVHPAPQERIYPLLGKDAPNGHVFFTADWIFWRTRQGGMEFAVHGASSSSTAPFPHSVPSKLNFDLKSGFRVGFGVHLPNDGWDIYVNYTDFRPKASKNSDGSIFPLLLFNPPATLTSSHAQWKITFQTLDIEIGRAFYIGKTLSLRPFIGMTGAWIDQDAQFEYNNSTIQDRIHRDNDFKGAGPRLGIGTNWHIGEGFSLFGNGAAILAVGHFDLENHQTQDGLETIRLEGDLNLISPVLQLIAGVAWDCNYDRGTRHVGLSAGFETQYWGRQNQIEQFTELSAPTLIRASEDLAFYGLTLRGRFDF